MLEWLRVFSCFIFVCIFKHLIELQLQPLRSSCSCSELWVTWETEGNPCITSSLDSLHQSFHLICHVPAVVMLLFASPVCVTCITVISSGSYWRPYCCSEHSRGLLSFTVRMKGLMPLTTPMLWSSRLATVPTCLQVGVKVPLTDVQYLHLMWEV